MSASSFSTDKISELFLLSKALMVIPSPMVTEVGSKGLSVIAISESDCFNISNCLSCDSIAFKLSSSDCVLSISIVCFMLFTVSYCVYMVLGGTIALYRVLRTQPRRSIYSWLVLRCV